MDSLNATPAEDGLLHFSRNETAAAAPASIEAADLIVDYLEKIGVEYVFGVPGGAIEPIYNALARSGRADGPTRPM